MSHARERQKWLEAGINARSSNVEATPFSRNQQSFAFSLLFLVSVFSFIYIYPTLFPSFIHFLFLPFFRKKSTSTLEIILNARMSPKDKKTKKEDVFDSSDEVKPTSPSSGGKSKLFCCFNMFQIVFEMRNRRHANAPPMSRLVSRIDPVEYRQPRTVMSMSLLHSPASFQPTAFSTPLPPAPVYHPFVSHRT